MRWAEERVSERMRNLASIERVREKRTSERTKELGEGREEPKESRRRGSDRGRCERGEVQERGETALRWRVAALSPLVARLAFLNLCPRMPHRNADMRRFRSR